MGAIEARSIFQAESKSISQLLLENGVAYYIPPYQRPYSWDEGKVMRLLEDTLHGLGCLLIDDDSFTFLGTIITFSDPSNASIPDDVRTEAPVLVLNIVDGQQRLTTLMILCVALHNGIEVKLDELKSSSYGTALPRSDSITWLMDEAAAVLKELYETFITRQHSGQAKLYPRIIRALDDKWSRDPAKALYESPIAKFISTYGEQLEQSTQVVGGRPKVFKPTFQGVQGQGTVVDRHKNISKVLLENIYSGKPNDPFDEFPEIGQILGNKKFQKALFVHEFQPDVVALLSTKTGAASGLENYKGLLRLLIFGRYILARVALTVVKGTNEHYAFSVFEALNTTGEPLTAFETFLPSVVHAETLAGYGTSPSKVCIKQIQDYLFLAKAGEPLQARTRELLIAFALAETGFKLSRQLTYQREYLKDQYDRYSKDPTDRLNFVDHLKDTAQFMKSAWGEHEVGPSLVGFTITSDQVKLCLAFLHKIGHTIAIAPLVRFYTVALKDPKKVNDFEKAIKALTAFSVLWRASRSGTGGIDKEYRDVMSGISSLTGLLPLARKDRKSPPGTISPPGVTHSVDVDKLKNELKARLVAKGGIADKEAWINKSKVTPIYKNGAGIARFLLLSAYHDTAIDPKTGKIIKGKAGVSPYLTYDGWRNENNLSLEHIAPKVNDGSWAKSIYTVDDVIDRLGNLVLLPQDANSSVGNRPWEQKAILYAALGAETAKESKTILLNSKVNFAQSTTDLVNLASYQPYLAIIGKYGIAGGVWNETSIAGRSEELLALAWDELHPWLD